MKLENIRILGSIQEAKGGSIAVANETRADSATLSTPLTSYAVGYRDPEGIEDTLEFVAPRKQVAGRRFEYKKNPDFVEIFSENEDGDVRSAGADFKVIRVNGGIVQAKTANKGLTYRIDLDEIDPAQLEAEKQRKVALLKRILVRSELIRALALHVAASSAVQKAWASSSTNTNPDTDVLSSIDGVRTSAGGGLVNRVLYTDSAWTRRILGLHALNTPAAGIAAMMTKEHLAGFLGVSGVQVCSAVYYDKSATTKRSGVGKASTSGYLGRVLGFYGLPGMDVDDPTTVSRFVSPNADGGFDFRVWEQQVNSQIVDLTVEHHSLIAATLTAGCFNMEVK